MNFLHKKIKILTGVKVIAVSGKEEQVLFIANVNPLIGGPRVTTGLVCEPIIEEKEVPIWESL